MEGLKIERMFKLAEERHISMRKLSSLIGISENTLCFWRNGKRSPRMDMIVKIADFFEVPVDYFFLNISENDDFSLEYQKLSEDKKERVKKYIKFLQIEDEL